MKIEQSVEDQVKILERFNEKINFLLDQYPEFVNPDKLEIRIRFPGREIEQRGPESRLVPAMLLVLRFFLMSEDTSLRKMGKMYKKLSISEEIRGEFYKKRDKINAFLDTGLGIKIHFKEDGKVGCLEFCNSGEGGNSKREALNLFRYEYYEHMNDDETTKQMEAIREMPLAFETIERLQLMRILSDLIQYISKIEQTNSKAISELKTIFNRK